MLQNTRKVLEGCFRVEDGMRSLTLPLAEDGQAVKFTLSPETITELAPSGDGIDLGPTVSFQRSWMRTRMGCGYGIGRHAEFRCASSNLVVKLAC